MLAVDSPGSAASNRSRPRLGGSPPIDPGRTGGDPSLFHKETAILLEDHHWRRLDQLHRLDGRQGDRYFGVLIAGRSQVDLVCGYVGIYTHRYPDYLRPGGRGNADE